MTDAADNKYLMVELEVSAANQQRFEQLMRALLPEVFENGLDGRALNWRLLTALRAPLDRDGRTGEEPSLLRYIHLWQLPIRTNLSEAMLSLGRNRLYHELNQLNVSETQDFFTAAVTYAPRESHDPATRRGRDALCLGAGTSLVMETIDVPANWFALHSWQEAMPSLAAEVAAESNMFLAFAIQAESGRLRRYVNFWRTFDAASEPTEAEARRSICGREIALLKLADLKQPIVAPVATRDSPYVRVPYTSVVSSDFRIYKEVDYRVQPT
ncbi:MAG TPA: hypothetical protein VJR89_18230 [Polyangiales bacterium]|nr:hypothetical protein [Polyangiales bacterium]